MKKLIDTLRNIWGIAELRSKIILTLSLLLIYRFGTFIVLPGIDPNKLSSLSGAKSGALGLIDAFSGGAFSQASVLALGIMPYISASIFMQLAGILIPQMQKIQKDGESGRNKINQWTRYLTVIVTFAQAYAYVSYLRSMGHDAIIESFSPYFWVTTPILLTAGTLFVMWLGEKITDKGLGNGTSIIIMIGILARFPSSVRNEFLAKSAMGSGGILIFVIEVAIMVAVILGLIVLIQGVRKVPVNYAKQIVGNRQFGGARQFLPLKVNAAGVMPIIFAQAIMFLPTLISYTSFENKEGISRIFSDPRDFVHMTFYAIVVIGFTFLYTSLIFNPKQVADDLKRNNGFVPGVKPGQPTADFIGSVMDKITLPGAILLAVVGILPGFAQRAGVTQGFASFYGGTSLLIMVAVILDTLQQIETQLLMRQYDGLMKSGRIQGRQSVTNAVI
ncbi:MAG: preprotein translocase subunit SecY [Bacteroidota bacterium]|nr:preprotein translocase subunit SecY [Bacteroidota bacterium]